MDFMKSSIDTEGAAAFLEELARRVRQGEIKVFKMKADEQPQYTGDPVTYDLIPTGQMLGDLKMTWEVVK